MKTSAIFLLLIFTSGVATANSEEDSLLTVLSQPLPDTARVNTLVALFSATGSNPEKFNNYGDKALRLAEEIKYDKGIADYYYWGGLIFARNNDLDKALKYWQKALTYYVVLNDIPKLAKTHNNLGLIQKHSAMYSDAYENFKISKDYAEKIGDKKQLAENLNNIGIVLKHIGRYQQAIEYYFNALQISIDLQDKLSIANSKGNIANLYNEQKNYQQAIRYYQELVYMFKDLGKENKLAGTFHNMGQAFIYLQNYDSAISYIQQAYEIFSKTNDLVGQASCLSTMGSFYKEQENYQRALEISQEALGIYQQLGIPASESMSYIEMGIYYTHLNNFNKAFEHLSKGLEIAQEINNIQRMADGNEGLYLYYEKIGNYKKSLDYHKEYSVMKDSLSYKNLNQRIVELSNEHELKEKETENKYLREKQAKQEEELLRRELENRVLIGGIIIFLLFVIYFYRISQQKKKTNYLLMQQNNEINLKQQQIIGINETLKKSQIQLHKANEELQRLNVDLETTIRERTFELQKSNEELDTFLYQSSHALRRPIVNIMGLVQIARLDPDRDNVDNVYNKIDDTSYRMDLMLKKLAMVSEINLSSLDFQPIDFENVLVETIASLNNFLKHKHIDFINYIDENIEFISDKRVIGIIFNNLLENSVIFSDFEKEGKPYIKINITETGDHVKIMLKDNGIGIPKEIMSDIFEMFSVGTNLSKGYGLGLYIVKKAVKKLNGQIHLDSREGAYTHFEILLPKGHKRKTLLSEASIYANRI